MKSKISFAILHLSSTIQEGLLLKNITLIILLVVSMISIPSLTWARPAAQRLSFAQQYFQTIQNHSSQASASGILTGDIYVNDVQSSKDLEFKLPITACIAGHCIDHDYGTSLKWVFSAKGNIIYHYDVPFTIQFDMPDKVYPGQIIRFEPHIVWDSPFIKSTQDYEFFHTTLNWVDLPADGMDDLIINFTQYATSARIEGKIPIVPGVSSEHSDFNETITFPPFNQGEGQWPPFGDYASKTILGGKGQQTCLGNTASNVNPLGKMPALSVSATCLSKPAWQQDTEYFKLAATVLESTPAAAAGLAIDAIREVGGLRLDEAVTGKIYRADSVNVQLSERPSMEVPRELVPGQSWNINAPLIVKYRVQSKSQFSYPLSYHLSFDWIGGDPQTIANEDLLSFFAGESDFTPWEIKESQVAITRTVQVVSQSDYYQSLIHVGEHFKEFEWLPSKMNVAVSAHPPGVKIADSKDAKKIIRQRIEISFPIPAAKQAFPPEGQYAVILGKTTQASAAQITEAFRGKGINAYVARIPDLGESVITFGSFIQEQDAQQFLRMLKEVFRIDGKVSTIVDKEHVSPIGADVLTKVRARRGR